MIEARLKEAALRLRRSAEAGTRHADDALPRQAGPDPVRLGSLARLEAEMQAQTAAVARLRQEVATLSQALLGAIEGPETPPPAGPGRPAAARRAARAFGWVLLGLALGAAAGQAATGGPASVLELAQSVVGG